MTKNVLHETKGSLLKCKELLLEWLLLLELILLSLHMSSSDCLCVYLTLYPIKNSEQGRICLLRWC